VKPTVLAASMDTLETALMSDIVGVWCYHARYNEANKHTSSYSHLNQCDLKLGAHSLESLHAFTDDFDEFEYRVKQVSGTTL